MKKMVMLALLQTCMIAGVPRSPAESPREVDEDEAKRLVDAGMAEFVDVAGGSEDLNDRTIKELREVARSEGFAVKPDTNKADLIAAINDFRKKREEDRAELEDYDREQLDEIAGNLKLTIAEGSDDAAVRKAIFESHYPPAAT